MRKKHVPSKRNPIARAVKKLRPKVVPGRRRQKLARARKREAEEEMEGKE